LRSSLLIVLVILFASCEPNIQNDSETLNKVFAMEKFDLEINQSGCFGGETILFKVKQEDTIYKLTSSKSNEWISIHNDSVLSLKKFLSKRIGVNSKMFCTGRLEVRVGNWFNSVNFIDNSCRDWEDMNEIINFSSLWPNY